MRFAFIHTADWQIGKRFGAFEAEKAAVLREQRLGAVDRLAKAARASGAATVLVAGDVFDSETVTDALVARLLSRLTGHNNLVWHLLSGNHDPARAGGVVGPARAVRLFDEGDRLYRRPGHRPPRRGRGPDRRGRPGRMRHDPAEDGSPERNAQDPAGKLLPPAAAEVRRPRLPARRRQRNPVCLAGPVTPVSVFTHSRCARTDRMR